MDKTKKKAIKDNISYTSKKISDNIGYIANQVDIIMNSRLVLAIFMIIDGFCFMTDPVNKMEFIAISIAIGTFLASGAVLITNIKSKYRDKKSIIIAILMIIISIIIFLYPKILAMNLRILLAIFIILDGLINIANTIKLDNISSQLSTTEDMIKNNFDKNEKQEDYNKGSIIKELDKIINPFNNIINHVNKKSALYFILNIISVVLGIVLLINNNTTLVVCGIILIYTGISDLLMFLKSIKLSKKIKEKENID